MQPEAENRMSETNIVENRKTQGKTNGKEKRDHHITNCIELKFQSVSHVQKQGTRVVLTTNSFKALKHFKDQKMILLTLAPYGIHILQYLVFFQVCQHQHTAQVEGTVHIYCPQGQYEELPLLTSTRPTQ